MEAPTSSTHSPWPERRAAYLPEDTFIGRNVSMRRLYGSLKLSLALGTFAIALGIAMAAWQDPFAPTRGGCRGRQGDARLRL